ncbi:MAG: FAD-dependent oxidoreductase [Spirochaetaceae bacterium]|nr:FAD-dependent oxidoreductase [Spirochaetaceae bacterium]
MKTINSIQKDYFNYIIIGASQAGLNAAERLRQLDKSASIMIISEESNWPYKRTKLSKNLNEVIPDNPFQLQESSWYNDLSLTLLRGQRVTEIFPKEMSLKLADNRTISFDRLLIATGAIPRKLPITGSEYVHYLRNLQDFKSIQHVMAHAKSALIIGGGVEGVELADQFNKAGIEVKILSRGANPMNHWLDPHLSKELQQIMEKRDILQYYLETPKKIEKLPQGYGLTTQNNLQLQGDIIVTSIGIVPRVDLLHSLGLCGDKGMIVSNQMESAIPSIYGAGDVLELPKDYPWGLWHSAEYQGKTAAENMTGLNVFMDSRNFRLKAEVFDQNYFSQGIIDEKQKNKVLFNKNNQYLKIFFKDNKISGALMANMKEISKPLEKYIQNNGSIEEINSLF